MSKNEINATVAKINELLQRTVIGSGTSTARGSARAEANALIETLPPRWWRRADEALIEQFTRLGAM